MTNLLDMLDGEKEVRADAPPPTGEIVDKSNIIGVVARFLATQLVDARGKTTPKHVFAIPGDAEGATRATFALWGDAMLNSLLRKVRAGELVGMIYDGKKPTGTDGNMAHTWRLRLITSTGDKLKDLTRAAEDAYVPLREAIETAKRDRAANFGNGASRSDEPPAPTDDDMPAWMR